MSEASCADPESSQRLVGDQRGQLRHGLAERVGGRLAIPQASEAVGDDGVLYE